MSDAELVLYCHELGWIARAWQGGAGVLLICCVWFGCRYYFDVGFRMPRLRRALRRAADERDKQKALAANAVIELARANGGPKAEVVTKLEAMVRSQEAELLRVDAIRVKTDAACTLFRAERDQALGELREERDLRQALDGLIAALNAEHIEVG